MSSRLDKAIKDFIQILREAGNKGTSPLDAQAEVLRIDEDGTAWVHLPGGVDETPVKLTINAKVGDKVYVRLSGGRAWITGNQTAPPTDDKTAEQAKEDAANASKVATNYLHYDSTDGLVLGNKESGSWVGYRTQIDTDSFNVLNENGNIIASYGSNEVELGKGNPNAIIKMCDGKAYVKNYIVGSQNTSVFCGQDVTVVGEWEGASEAYALFKQGFINIGQASSHIKFFNENGNMNQVEIQGQNITINGELVLGTALSIANGGTGATTAAGALANLGIKPIKAGDTVNVTWNGATYLTSSKTEASLSIPLRRPILANSVSCTSNSLITRQSGNYTHGSSATAGVAWTVNNCEIREYGIHLSLSRTTTTNAVNNDSIGVNAVLTFAFS